MSISAVVWGFGVFLFAGLPSFASDAPMEGAPIGAILRLSADLPLPDFRTRRIKAVYFQDGGKSRKIDLERPMCGITFSDRRSFEAIYAFNAIPKGDYLLLSTMRAPVIGEFRDSWTLQAPENAFTMHLYCRSRELPVTTGEMIQILGVDYASVLPPRD